MRHVYYQSVRGSSHCRVQQPLPLLPIGIPQYVPDIHDGCAIGAALGLVHCDGVVVLEPREFLRKAIVFLPLDQTPGAFFLQCPHDSPQLLLILTGHDGQRLYPPSGHGEVDVELDIPQLGKAVDLDGGGQPVYGDGLVGVVVPVGSIQGYGLPHLQLIGIASIQSSSNLDIHPVYLGIGPPQVFAGVIPIGFCQQLHHLVDILRGSYSITHLDGFTLPGVDF